ncbi:MAG TPA: protein kinase [Nitrospiria bacterium]
MKATPFGKYTLLERIGTGGMAELFLAKQEGMEGFEKILAIKRILPHLTQDNEFVQMFINEAKLAALLTHQNIVQIYDLGSAVPMGLPEPSYYIAMEYIKGKDLRSIINALRAIGTPFPINHALSLMNKVCCGLDYAHRKKNSQGKDLHIVHRDISPQNILVSYDGDVKVVDFGIAKAASHGTETRTGLLKGKLAYMSPEQAWGKPVDRRTDIFAMGIVLYEILTGERLFKGENEISTLEKVREAKVPSASFFNPQVDEELNQILLKALAKYPSDRYQTASEMALSLENIISKKGYSFSSLSLSNYMQHLFQQKVEEETKRIHWASHSHSSGLEPPFGIETRVPQKGPLPLLPKEPMGAALPTLGPINFPSLGGHKPHSSSSFGQPLEPFENKDPGLPHYKPQHKPSQKTKTSGSAPSLRATKNNGSHPVLKTFLFSFIFLLLSVYISSLYNPNFMKKASNHFPLIEKTQKILQRLKVSFLGGGNKTVPTLPPDKNFPLDRLKTVSLSSTSSPHMPQVSPPPSALSAPIPHNKEDFLSQNRPQEKDQGQESPNHFPPTFSKTNPDGKNLLSPKQIQRPGQHLRTLSQHKVQELFEEVKLAYNQGDLDTMERKLRRIIEITPNSSNAYHLLGTVYLNRNDKDSALRIFSEASSTFPNDPLLHYDLGFLYYEKNLLSLAGDEFSKAVSLAPNAPRAERARKILQEMGGPP